ncbi:hypothetical protein KKC32_03000 [Patescibacteria group bacterium]|nr:hypothetical protein [Patescibacteria group bacterium]
MTEQIKQGNQNLETLAVKANLSNIEREYFEKLKAELKQLLGGKTLEDIEKTQDLVLARKVSKKMSQILEFLKTKEVETKGLIIKDAKNPFAEAFKDGGVDAPETIDYELDFEELADMNAAVYENRGLLSWAEEVKRAKEKLGKMSLEKLEIIKQEIKEGAIPIIMPGKRVMLETTLDEIKKLTPRYKSEGAEIAEANESLLEWEYLKGLIESGNELLVSDIPDEPYILLTKPTQKSELRNKSVDEQKIAITELNENRTEENKMYAMNLHEYAAMQTVFAEEMIERSEDEDAELSKLNPLDFGFATWTRFVSLPAYTAPGSSSVLVPFGDWDRLAGQLIFGVGNVYASDGAGVRLSVRVEF